MIMPKRTLKTMLVVKPLDELVGNGTKVGRGGVGLVVVFSEHDQIGQ